jgi:protein deglycase
MSNDLCIMNIFYYLTDKIQTYSESDVVVDGNVITSKGPATSLHFSLKLVAILYGEVKANEVGKAMLA